MNHSGYVHMGAFYFMYGFKVIGFYPVHTNPFKFGYGFSKGVRLCHDDNENMATRG